MKTFEIQYVGRYEENKEYYTSIIEARTEKSALNKFAKMFGIYQKNINTKIHEISWWDNDWLMKFKCINETQEKVCQVCNGTGKLLTKNK